MTYLLLSFPQPILLALLWGCYTRCGLLPMHSILFLRVTPFHRLDSCPLTTFNKSILHFLCIKRPAWKEIRWVASSKQLSRETIITFRKLFSNLGFTQTTRNRRICWSLVSDVFCLRLEVYRFLKPLSGIPCHL